VYRKPIARDEFKDFNDRPEALAAVPTEKRNSASNLLESKHEIEEMHALLRFEGVESSRAELILTTGWTVEHKPKSIIYKDGFLNTALHNRECVKRRFGIYGPADEDRDEVLVYKASVWCARKLRWEEGHEIPRAEFLDAFTKDDAATDWPPDNLERVRSRIGTKGSFKEWTWLKIALHDAFPRLTKESLQKRVQMKLVIQHVTWRTRSWREKTLDWCVSNLKYSPGNSLLSIEVRMRFSKEAANFGWPPEQVQRIAAHNGGQFAEFRDFLKPAVIAACSEDCKDDSNRPWYDATTTTIRFRNVAWKKEPSSGAQPNVHAPAPAPMSDSSEEEKKEPASMSSDGCEIIEPPSPAPVDYMNVSGAQAMAMTIVGGHGDVPPSAAPVAAPAPGVAAEVAAAPTPAAASPWPRRRTGHAQDVADSEEAKKVERDDDDEAEI